MIILSIPYYSEVSRVENSAADLIEYRLDYALNPDAIDFGVFTERNILCWRGLDADSPIIPHLLASRATVDLPFGQLPEGITNYNKLIISLHLQAFDAEKIRTLLSYPHKPYSFKIVFEAESFAEILACYTLISKFPELHVIFNVSGKWATFQRCLYKHFGSKAVYLYDQISTHPGQLSLERYQLIVGNGIDSESILNGIIGGAQVPESLSMLHFNQRFRKVLPHFHYLPFPTNDEREIVELLLWLLKRFELQLLSVTSPFKKRLATCLELSNPIINTIVFNPRSDYNSVLGVNLVSYNTDALAVIKGIRVLNGFKNDKIFIYGRSASTEAIRTELARWSHPNVFHNAKNDTPTPVKEVDVLVNASSTLFFEGEPGFGLPKFKKLIELPYQLGVKSSLVSYANKHCLRYIDGEKFFEIQHDYQLQALAKSLNVCEITIFPFPDIKAKPIS